MLMFMPSQHVQIKFKNINKAGRGKNARNVDSKYTKNAPIQPNRYQTATMLMRIISGARGGSLGTLLATTALTTVERVGGGVSYSGAAAMVIWMTTQPHTRGTHDSQDRET